MQNSILKKGGHYDNFLGDRSEKINGLHADYDAQFKVVFDAIRQLMAPKEAPKKRIGFQLKEKRAAYRAKG